MVSAKGGFAVRTPADILRLFDRKAWAAHIYVTDQCNLDCHYCNEYDNSVPHPTLDALTERMEQVRRLGCVRLGLQGGEPLLHPDIAEIIHRAKAIGFGQVGMSTNGFRLTRSGLKELEAAGLDSLQVSVDRATPTDCTKKALKSVRNKLDWFADSPIRLNVAAVLMNETVDEVDEIIDYCHARSIPVAARVVHDDLINERDLRGSETAKLRKVLERQASDKAAGLGIHSSWSLLDYQMRMLDGESQDWSCVGGYKYFFVSATGKFWLCSQVRTEMDVMEVTPEILKSFDKPKDCQAGCGVYCIAEMSLAVSHPGKYLGHEIARRAPALARKAVGANKTA
jgi:molybdenum cofactor biosynthesis enzyme MoaA